jgi:small-conductance mechanosensitive channel
MNEILSFLPLFITIFSVAGVVWLTNWLLLKRVPDLDHESRFLRQLLILGLTLAGVICIVLVLPVVSSTRNQIIGLVGLVISGVIAFSSTNIVANLMAGFMLRFTKTFQVGDYIRIGDTFGRVVARGLFDTEIQTETAELISVPNTNLISQPHTVIRSSGTIVSATLSLGYDLCRTQVEDLLLLAAKKSGLSKAFVHIIELGDYSVTYRVNGMLIDVKTLLTTRSNLNANILDVFHEAGLEIVSPAFINQRFIRRGQMIIPQENPEEFTPYAPLAEQVIFDKAEMAEKRSTLIKKSKTLPEETRNDQEI